MKNIFGILLLLCLVSARTDSGLGVTFSNIQATIHNGTVKGEDKHISLQTGARTSPITLIHNDSMHIDASFKLTTNNGVVRSNMKKSSINVNIKYYFEYRGISERQEQERIFYMDDSRRFDEEVKLAMHRGLKNYVINLKYTGQLE